MKSQIIIALFTLVMMAKGAFWTGAIQPFILSLGAILGAIDSDVLEVDSIKWRNFLPFVNK